ncbi:MAG: galactose-1-phosphate uridylyltransferase [Armatimonadota bacterium]
MSQLRKDPVLDRWVIIAVERGHRPSDFKTEPSRRDEASCPLCEGSESYTPPEIWAERPEGSAPDGPGWEVRVVPNKFPALTIEGGLDRRGVGMYDMMNGIGAHEVIIETPDHYSDIPDNDDQHVAKVLTAYRERILDLRHDDRLRYVLVFRNHGEVAGASLSHPHSQLIALTITPNLVKQKLKSARSYYLEKERCIFCDMISQELDTQERVVFESPGFVVLSPFAARFPFELSIYPKRHTHDFCAMDQHEMDSLAAIMKQALGCLRDVLGNPPYNYVLHTSPNLMPRAGRPDYWGTLPLDFHWHVEIYPRLTRMAGFEWGTGFYINPVAPEEAARVLRAEPAAVEAATH